MINILESSFYRKYHILIIQYSQNSSIYNTTNGRDFAHDCRYGFISKVIKIQLHRTEFKISLSMHMLLSNNKI